MEAKIILAIAGGSSSGKSAIAKDIKSKLCNEKSVVILSYDDYYKDQSHVSFEDRQLTNYDHPDAFDLDLFVRDVSLLSKGQRIEKPVYDFKLHNRSSEVEMIEPGTIIVLEGLFVLHEKTIRDVCDVLLYVDTPADIRFLRRVTRDVKERGRSIESVCNQYEKTVRVMHAAFIEPSKQLADVIIPSGVENQVAIDLVCTKIRSIKD